MEPVDYVRGIRRRWKVVLASVIVALAIGLIFAGGGGTPSSPSTQTDYRATTYMLSSTSGTGIARAPSSLATVATIATLGEVPKRVADALPFEMTPAQVASVVTVNPDDETGLLGIAATAPTATRAKVIADTYAKELQGFLRDRTLEQAQAIQREIDRLDHRIAAQDEGGAGTSDAASAADKGGGAGATSASQDSLELRRSFLAQQYAQLVASTGGDASGLEILAPAEAALAPPDAGIEAPRSRWIRLLIAAGIGLLFGIVLALLMERFDTKIRSRSQTEEILGLPVLGEIPVVTRRQRGTIVIESSPSAGAANAFRFLASALQLGGHDGATPTDTGNGHHHTKTILVTSAAPSEGKSTIVSNLAVAFAELGRRVVVVCCDFRHPTIHLSLGVEQGPGLTEALSGEHGDAEDLLQPTRFESVRVLSTGSIMYRAGMFGSDQMSGVLADVGEAADVVLIDTAPLLAESDWTAMLPDVDAVLLVARAGKTEAASLERVAEMLSILHAPVVGVALNSLPPSSVNTSASWYRVGAKRVQERDQDPSEHRSPEEAHANSDQNGQTGETAADEASVAGAGDSGA